MRKLRARRRSERRAELRSGVPHGQIPTRVDGAGASWGFGTPSTAAQRSAARALFAGIVGAIKAGAPTGCATSSTNAGPGDRPRSSGCLGGLGGARWRFSAGTLERSARVAVQGGRGRRRLDRREHRESADGGLVGSRLRERHRRRHEQADERDRPRRQPLSLRVLPRSRSFDRLPPLRPGCRAPHGRVHGSHRVRGMRRDGRRRRRIDHGRHVRGALQRRRGRSRIGRTGGERRWTAGERRRARDRRRPERRPRARRTAGAAGSAAGSGGGACPDLDQDGVARLPATDPGPQRRLQPIGSPLGRPRPEARRAGRRSTRTATPPRAPSTSRTSTRIPHTLRKVGSRPAPPNASPSSLARATSSLFKPSFEQARGRAGQDSSWRNTSPRGAPAHRGRCRSSLRR